MAAANYSDMKRRTGGRKKIKPKAQEKTDPEAEDKAEKHDDGLDITTTCPLCKNTIETPKELTCLHTFCERCIGQYICASVGDGRTFRFRCPECLELQGGEIPSEIAASIARSLPTNHFVSSLLAKARTPKCKPCAKNNKNTDGYYWCNYCAGALCFEHNDYHGEITPRATHKVYKIADMDRFPDEFYAPAVCENHPNKVYTLFCKDHRVCICEECRKKTHKGCFNVVDIDEEANELRKGIVADTLERKLNTMNSHIEFVVEELEKNSVQIEEKRTNSDSKIKDVRKEIDLHLNHLEKKLLSNLFKLCNDRVDEIKIEIEGFETKREAMHEYNSLFHALLEYGTGIQILIELPILTRNAEILSAAMTHRLSHMQSSELQVTLSDTMDNMRSLGRVVDIDLLMKPMTPAKSKIEILARKPTADSIQKLPKFRSKVKPGFLAIRYPSSMLTGGSSIGKSILLVDNTCKEIRSYLKDGTRDQSLNLQEIRTKGHPWDVTELDPELGVGVLAFTLPDQSKFVTIHKKRLNDPEPTKQTYSTQSPCYGITFTDRRLIMACLKHLDVWRLSVFSEPAFETRIATVGENVQYVHAVDKNRIYYTNSTERGSVHCVSLDKTSVFQYQHDKLLKPRGVVTDMAGNVHVAGYMSNNIHKLTSEGDLIQIIVPRISLFTKPCVLLESDGVIYCVYAKHKLIPIL